MPRGGLHTNRGHKRAREARDELGAGAWEPLCVLSTAERDGLAVLLCDLPPGCAGAYLRDRWVPLAFVNAAEHPVRRRFTLAHELGHHRLGHRSTGDRVEDLRDTTDPFETEANAFAAELLVPHEAVERYLDEAGVRDVDLGIVVALACAYGVSAHVALYRLWRYDHVTDAQRDGLVAMLEQMWHHDERRALGLENDFGDRLQRARGPLVSPQLRGTELAAGLDRDGPVAAAIARLAAARRATA